MENFYIFLTFDIDQDFSPGNKNYYNRDNIKFKGFEEGIIKIIDQLNEVPFSVFLRADYQVKEVYGSYDYLIDKYPYVIDKIKENNGEINWHIHLYEKINNRWKQIKKEKKVVERFQIDYDNVKDLSSINSNIVRIGECVMNDKLMEFMNNNNIKIDSTALPGRKRNDTEKYFNWEKTNNSFYHPSKTDYQTIGDYEILEVPMTTIDVEAEYDDQPYKRYFNLSFKTKPLFENMNKYIRDNNFLVTITHPYEILNEGNHGLISYNFNIFCENLKLLIDYVKKAGKNPVFKKIGDIINEENNF